MTPDKMEMPPNSPENTVSSHLASHSSGHSLGHSPIRSPWAGLQGVEQVTVKPVKSPVAGDVAIPGSKSLTNRALLIAAVAEGPSTLKNILKSDDSWWCLEALKVLGVRVEIKDADVRLTPPTSRWPDLTKPKELYIGSAGTIARFLPGLLAATEGEFIINASEQLCGRPMALLIEALQTLGAEIKSLAKLGHYPLEIKGGSLKGGEVSISGRVSSQFISGLLMAAPLASEPMHLTITDPIVQQDYVRLTLETMTSFGVEVTPDEDLGRFDVSPQSYQGTDYTVEADASTASYFAALAAVTGGRVTLQHLLSTTTQPDIFFLEVLEQMGCAVTRKPHSITVQGPENGQLKGNLDIDMKPMSDTALTLAAIAPFADGPVRVHNIAHIRHHESDRIRVIVEAMNQMGIVAEEFEDGFTIQPGVPQHAVLETHDDHRVAMALAVTGVAAIEAGAGVTLKDPGCVSKTCPQFFQMLQGLGVTVT